MKSEGETGCACASTKSCVRYLIGLDFSHILFVLKIFSFSGTPIRCNCDDQRTGLIDENMLKSKDHLPVQG